MRLTVRRISAPPFKEANTIDDFKPVRSGLDISKHLKDFLIMCDPVKYPPGDDAKIVHNLNDTLQGRGKRTVEDLLAEMDEVCGHLKGCNEEWCMFREQIKDFQHQKELLTQPYTKSSNKRYRFEMNGILKVIDQRLYDRAVKDGFPPDFFCQSYFDRVTFYCLLDDANMIFSTFNNCTFAVCRIRQALFDGASLYGSEFHSCVLEYATFFRANIAHTHFHDCRIKNVSFQEARLKSCNTVDCGLEGVGFLNATLDGCFFGRVAAHGIRNLHTATITQGGATDEEIWHNCGAVLSALRPQQGERRDLPTKKRGVR